MVVKLLLPGQEDVGHLLLALPAAKERDGTVRAQPCNQHSVGEYWSHIPEWGPKYNTRNSCFTLGK